MRGIYVALTIPDIECYPKNSNATSETEVTDSMALTR